MRFRDLLLPFILLQLFLGLLVPSGSTRVAIVVCPTDDLQPLENRAIEALQRLQYEIIHVNNSNYIPVVQADKVIVLYVGHGIFDHPNVMLTITNNTIHLSSVINQIQTPQLILLTGSCFGGNWLTFASENRIVISSANDTNNYLDMDYWSTPDMTTLLDYGQTNSVEDAYQCYINELNEYYQPFFADNPFLKEVTPVIFDGIEGDTYF